MADILAATFLLVDIALNKFNHPSIRSLIAKYSQVSSSVPIWQNIDKVTESAGAVQLGRLGGCTVLL